MFCKKCGTQNTDGVRFCKKCGAELTPQGTASAQMPQPASMPPQPQPQSAQPQPAYPPQLTQQQPTQVQPYAQPMPQANTKSNAKSIGIIVAAVVAVIAIVGIGILVLTSGIIPGFGNRIEGTTWYVAQITYDTNEGWFESGTPEYNYSLATITFVDKNRIELATGEQAVDASTVVDPASFDWESIRTTPYRGTWSQFEDGSLSLTLDQYGMLLGDMRARFEDVDGGRVLVLNTQMFGSYSGADEETLYSSLEAAASAAAADVQQTTY